MSSRLGLLKKQGMKQNSCIVLAVVKKLSVFRCYKQNESFMKRHFMASSGELGWEYTLYLGEFSRPPESPGCRFRELVAFIHQNEVSRNNLNVT